MQNYGNTSGSLNRLLMTIGKLDINTYPQPYALSDSADCITCKIRKTNRLPFGPKNGIYNRCVIICKPTLKNMGNQAVLTDYTRAQLMVKYPDVGLHVRMCKEQMIQIIEIHLLENELFPNKQSLGEVM